MAIEVFYKDLKRELRRGIRKLVPKGDIDNFDISPLEEEIEMYYFHFLNERLMKTKEV